MQKTGDELKLVFPQADAEPHVFEGLAFRHFFLQPMDGPDREANTELAVRYCLEHPQWRLSLQTHKMVGIQLVFAVHLALAVKREQADPLLSIPHNRPGHLRGPSVLRSGLHGPF